MTAPLNRRALADICRVVTATEHRRTRTLARARHAAADVEWQFRLAALPPDQTERGMMHPTCEHTEGVPPPTDTPQIGYLRSLAEKRDGAFLYTREEHRAAWQEWTATHPQWTAAHKPIRNNWPEAGTRGWEWESAAPSEPRWHRIVRWPLIAAGCVAAAYLALWLLPVVGEWVRR